MNQLKHHWQQLKARYTRPLPVVHTPYRAALERAQRQYFLAFLLLLLLFGYYAYRYTQHQATQNQLVEVVVAKTDLAAPKTLEPSDLSLIQLPQKWVPTSAQTSVETLRGKTLRRSLEANEVLVKLDTQDDLNPDSVSAQFDQAFAFTLGEDWLVAKLPNLKPGDTVDILATNPEANTEATTVVAAALRVITLDKAGARKNLVINTTAEQAQALLFTRGLRLPMQVITHSAIAGPSVPNPEISHEN